MLGLSTAAAVFAAGESLRAARAVVGVVDAAFTEGVTD